SLEDLNQQAFEWATVRMEHRPVAKTGLIPAQAFEQERTALVALPAHLPAPYLCHERKTDQYGYVPFDGNYYWIPSAPESQERRSQSRDVKVLEYSDRLQIYQNRQGVAQYALPPDGVKNRLFSPEGMPKPERQPKDRRRPTEEEEKRLRALSPTVGNYLDFVLPSRSGIERHHFLRELFVWAERCSSRWWSVRCVMGSPIWPPSSASHASCSARAARCRCRVPKWMRASRTARPTSKAD